MYNEIVNETILFIKGAGMNEKVSDRINCD